MIKKNLEIHAQHDCPIEIGYKAQWYSFDEHEWKALGLIFSIR